ncbi:lipopolysaccharide biosynthesis protein [Tenacibaculum discolor]|uniref:lipopolysaccharide biosynthesis protein n=1 Tax=Tenacibaculum discolor TaxID=361581 RepID=UPI000F2934FA|nr:polysaccharide biosynthesis protein [Tenacibaculum discolor]RLJ97681.1 Na+-driven multidrug efflux pump [Tenacibaculum discolor]
MRSSIAINTLFLYFRLVFLMFISFYTSRILLELLGVEDYGVYNVVGSLVAIFSSVKGLMTSSTQRFLNYEMGKGRSENINVVFSMSIMIHIALSVLFFIIVEAFGVWYIENKLVIAPERLSAAFYVFHFSLLSVIVSIMSIPYDALIVANEKMKVYAYISILDGILKLLLILVLLYSTVDSLILYSVGVFIITIVIRGASSLYCKRTFKDIKFRISWESNLFKEMLKFSGWQFFGNTGYAIQNQGINMLLNLFYGPALNTVRGLSQKVSGALQMFTQNLLIASNPQIVKLYAQGEQERFIHLVLKVMKYSFFLIMMLMIPFLLFTIDLLDLWLKEVPSFLEEFIQLTLIYSMVRVFHNPIDSAIKAKGDIRSYQIFDSFFLLLSLPLSYFFLLKGFPPVSVIVSMIIMEVINLIFLLFYTKKKLNIKFFEYFNVVGIPVIVVVSIELLFFYVKNQKLILLNTFFDKIIFVSINYILILSFIWFVGTDESEKQFLINKIKRKI